MLNSAETFFNSLRNKKIALIGFGVSHIDLAKLLVDKNLDVTVCDKREMSQLEEKIVGFDSTKIKFELGENYLANICNYDIIFRTPGMKFYTPELMEAIDKGCVVTSEMEVFFDLCPCKTIAVTGSDGKTTTTTLIAEMLKKQGYTVHLGGNIGRALLPIIETIKPEDFAVVELSSFQLISMRKSPDVAVVTNLAPNHLDMHKDMQEYIDAKKNIFLHQNAFSKTVLNADNEITNGFSSLIRGKTFYFSRTSKVNKGTYLNEKGNLVLNSGDVETELFNKDEIRIPGMHNVENFLAAIAAVCDFVSPETMRDVAKNFGGVEHRIEFVRELDGVKWYNDSIATSPTRAIAGLVSFGKPIILIAGGYDKKIPFEPLVPYILKYVKKLVLCGNTAQKIEDAVTTSSEYSGSPEIIRVSDIPEAVKTAKCIAQTGDIISLSPACASFDCYPNFEERGKHFKKLVKEL